MRKKKRSTVSLSHYFNCVLQSPFYVKLYRICCPQLSLLRSIRGFVPFLLHFFLFFTLVIYAAIYVFPLTFSRPLVLLFACVFSLDVANFSPNAMFIPALFALFLHIFICTVTLLGWCRCLQSSRCHPVSPTITLAPPNIPHLSTLKPALKHFETYEKSRIKHFLAKLTEKLDQLSGWTACVERCLLSMLVRENAFEHRGH